ncbi:Apple domain-containing protein, partial [Durusdinium trenchii]
ISSAVPEQIIDGSTIQRRFEFMFPSSQDETLDRRTLDITNDPASVRFIFHPDPTATLEIGEGLFEPGTYPDSCTEDPAPFDFAVEGNNFAALRFEFRQVYLDSFCNKMPDFTSDLDPCSALTGGCEVGVAKEEYQGINLTMARAYVFTGEPRNQGSSVADFVGPNKISYAVYNPTFFGFTDRLDGKAFEGASKILLLGNKVLTEDSLVSFFSEGQDHIPLLYLNAPPPGKENSNFQSVTLDLSVTTTTKKYATTDIRVGGGAFLGIKNEGDARLCIPFLGCPIKITEGNQKFTAGVNNFDTETTSYTDDVHVQVKSTGLTLSTPKGLTGDEGDMVLLIGTVANFITADFVSFDVDTCSVDVRPSTVWGTDMESLLFYSRADIELEFDKLERTIRDSNLALEDDTLADEARDEAERLIRVSTNSKKKWDALFEHWDNDREQALADANKVDLRGVVTGVVQDPDASALNRFTLGASELTVSRTVTMSDSSVLDYQSSSNVISNEEKYEFELLFGSGFIVGPVGGGSFEYSSSTATTFSETGNEQTQMT